MRGLSRCVQLLQQPHAHVGAPSPNGYKAVTPARYAIYQPVDVLFIWFFTCAASSVKRAPAFAKSLPNAFLPSRCRVSNSPYACKRRSERWALNSAGRRGPAWGRNLAIRAAPIPLLSSAKQTYFPPPPPPTHEGGVVWHGNGGSA